MPVQARKFRQWYEGLKAKKKRQIILDNDNRKKEKEQKQEVNINTLIAALTALGGPCTIKADIKETLSQQDH